MNFFFKIPYIIILYFYYSIKINKKSRKNFDFNEYNKNYINYFKSLKKVVYTILIGNYDNIHPIIKENGYDYFMITDQNFENKTDINWTILNIDKKIKFKNKKDLIKKQRFYKTHPHLFFPNYNLSIYIDATYEIKGKLDDFLLRILTPKSNIYLLEHPDRNSINNEFDAVVFSKRELINVVDIIKNRYKLEKFPDNNGLAETCLIVRKHNESNCKKFMELWFQEIKQNSHRDQLSFNYILWKTGNEYVKYISKIYTSQYFIQYPYHLKVFQFDNNITT